MVHKGSKCLPVLYAGPLIWDIVQQREQHAEHELSTALAQAQGCGLCWSQAAFGQGRLELCENTQEF